MSRTIAILVFAILLTTLQATAAPITGRVIGITDGDTLTVRTVVGGAPLIAGYVEISAI